MKIRYSILLILFIVLTTLSFAHNVENLDSLAVQTDTLNNSISEIKPNVSDDFSPMLFFMLLMAIAFVLFCVGAGIVLTILVLSFIFFLVSFGVISTSLIVGLNKKSFSKGFKTFTILSSTVFGLLVFSLGFWIFNKIVHWWSAIEAISIGALCGLLYGFLFGLLVYYVLRRLTTFFKEKLKLDY